MYRFLAELIRRPKQDTPPDAVQPSRFEVGVAVAVAAAFGILTSVLVGMVVIAVTVWILPSLGPALLGAAALAGMWLMARGGRSAKGFGLGLLIGWALLAVWTSGASVGFDIEP